jgi:hypothetical protein
MGASLMEMFEILVPTVRNDGRPISTRFHRVWDAKVRAISGGLTVLSPARGQWVSPDGRLFHERMIPVRIACEPDQMEAIADLTARYYEQLAILYYRVSDHVRIKHYDSAKKFRPVSHRE